MSKLKDECFTSGSRCSESSNPSVKFIRITGSGEVYQEKDFENDRKHMSKWNDVKESLPQHFSRIEQSCPCLVFCDDATMEVARHYAQCDPSEWKTDGGRYLEVTHWKQLPLSPDLEDENG